MIRKIKRKLLSFIEIKPYIEPGLKNLKEEEVIGFILDHKFIDRYESDSENAVDVIIPLLNSNPLFEQNLINYYKRIPIRSLLIGDGGCQDNSIEIVKKFPRVKIIEKFNTTLGYRIKILIQACESEFFVYLHSDILLPENWFDVMYSHRFEHKWYESKRKNVAIIVWERDFQNNAERAYSGSQFGTTKALQEAVESVEDDYLFRTEDYVLSELVGKKDYVRYNDTFNYHQLVNVRGTTEPPYIITPLIKRSKNVEYEKMVWEGDWKGLVKYCSPKPYLVKHVNSTIKLLKIINQLDELQAKEWVLKTNEQWYPYIWKKPWYKFW